MVVAGTIVKWPGYFLLLKAVLGSVGDNSIFYTDCVRKCNERICLAGKHEIFREPVLGVGLSLWSCLENCEYKCQWKTVDFFEKNKWAVPQFKGKWPFIRFMGFQEPASVFFSVLNFVVVFKLIMSFRKKVSKSTPYYNIWSIFGLVQLNSWLWSSVYHSRDTDFTERMDYMSATLVILYSFYAVGLRYMSTAVNMKTFLWTVFCASLGLNHLLYLAMNNFDYGYNMQFSCMIGGLTVAGWIVWSLIHFNTRFYVWKIFLFSVLTVATALLELMDFPPILWLIDAHALWHGCTTILNVLFFLFVIDDCNNINYVQLKKI